MYSVHLQNEYTHETIYVNYYDQKYIHQNIIHQKKTAIPLNFLLFVFFLYI